MDANLDWLANFLWGLADDVLRDFYVRANADAVRTSLADLAASFHEGSTLPDAMGARVLLG